MTTTINALRPLTSDEVRQVSGGSGDGVPIVNLSLNFTKIEYNTRCVNNLKQIGLAVHNYEG